MSNKDWTTDYITLRGEEVKIRIGILPQIDLKFFPENPRIYSILSAWEKEPDQNEIEETLTKRDHVKQLMHSIKANGGLTDPIFVRDQSNEVLEGNSRLAAYRILAKVDPIKWGYIKCKILPNELADDKIFSLLGEYHIIGRQDWAPYEQAGYLYRRIKKYSTSSDALAKDLGLTKSKVNHLIKVYEYMKQHGDGDVNHWSYYDELLKSRKIKNCNSKYKGFTKLATKLIKQNKINKAADIRDKLPKIAVSNKKTIKSFISEKHDFYDSYEHALQGGANEYCYNKIRNFRTWFVEPAVKNDIEKLPKQVRKKTLYEIRKISATIGLIMKKID